MCEFFFLPANYFVKVLEYIKRVVIDEKREISLNHLVDCLNLFVTLH